jgi:hypothetical protein
MPGHCRAPGRGERPWERVVAAVLTITHPQSPDWLVCEDPGVLTERIAAVDWAAIPTPALRVPSWASEQFPYGWQLPDPVAPLQALATARNQVQVADAVSRLESTSILHGHMAAVFPAAVAAAPFLLEIAEQPDVFPPGPPLRPRLAQRVPGACPLRRLQPCRRHAAVLCGGRSRPRPSGCAPFTRQARQSTAQGDG